MRIGLLQCDEVVEELQPQFGTYPEMFKKLFDSVAHQIEWKTYRVMDGELPETIDECDGYITSGSRYGVNDGYSWINALEGFVISLVLANKKYVGICFGHQLLAKAMDGIVERSNKGWGVGLSFNQVGGPQDWMQPAQEGLDLIVSHQDQISVLPKEARVLASSAFCPYYLLQYGDYQMTVQGHPEFSKDYSSALMEFRHDRIPAARRREGQASLSANVDDHLMAQWIINFFNG